MTSEQVRVLIRAASDGNQAAWAQSNGLSPSYVSDVLMGRREPGPKVLDALGLTRRVVYERALSVHAGR